MKQGIVERFWVWVCDTVGHAKSGPCNAEWTYEGFRHYGCTRCGRIVSTPEPPNAPLEPTAGTEDEERDDDERSREN